MASTPQQPRCKALVLDAGPLLSLSPLRGLAETYITVPQVLAELKDKNAKEHLERLGLNYGIKIEVKNPNPASIAAVIQWAKKTGDYPVLSHPDMCVLALTHTLHEEVQSKKDETSSSSQTERDQEQQNNPSQSSTDGVPDLEEEAAFTEGSEIKEEQGEPGSSLEGEQEQEPLNVELHPVEEQDPSSSSRPADSNPPQPTTQSSDTPLYEDPSDSDDGEGEWITPTNVGLHKSRALDLLPSDSGKKGKGKDEFISVGCMTADFAMQNVLLQMGLNLVGTEGKRIQRVKTWVLRCHACFKICKDSSKKFCPSCGNPSLLRASVTLSAPDADTDAPVMQVHLKPNFQYKIRGTKYSIPAPKPGSAKTGPGEGLILREDQAEYMRAQKRADSKREREEAKMMKGVLSKGVEGGSVAVGSWMDPDWIPEIMSASSGGKGRSSRGANDMPAIGYGKKNPNERRRKA
ncbi:20S-pre-rRNA D-site endonuclease nob1 [Marasmius crinis-equi]|uniref:20S-pre-rRNA D-site endonuclease NOB1 n=1 Tax=Marasmius crinis-equi TaxID=585013 RepID=A0ABR3FXA2_9AGAR